MKLEAAKLRGRLVVTVNPDPWVPMDGEPVACTYDADAALTGTEVAFRRQPGTAKPSPVLRHHSAR